MACIDTICYGFENILIITLVSVPTHKEDIYCNVAILN